MSNETIIDMTPNADGVFEAEKTSKAKRKKKSHRDVRPEPTEQACPARRKSKRKVKRNPVERVPNPVEEFQDGVQAGLDLLEDVAGVINIFRMAK